MFEKEAEERVKHLCLSRPNAYVPVTSVEYWQDGAEFGYNKAKEEIDYLNQHWKSEEERANEWHYVKDGLFPTHSYRVLVFTDEGVGFGIYGLDNKKWYTYDTGFEVIAWKEIVLPELKESEQ